MNEEQLSRLSPEDKLKVTQFLIADIAAQLMSSEPGVSSKARHDLGALAMTFSNLHQLVTSRTDVSKVIATIYDKFRFRGAVEEVNG